MQNKTGTSLQDYWTVLRRRRLMMAWVFVGVLLAVTSVTWFLPEVYRSAAFIRIEIPDLREGLVSTTVDTADTDLRIDRMRDRVVRNSNLDPIIEEFSLYPELPPDERASEMRRNIETPKVLDSNDPRVQFQSPRTIGFEVAFYHRSPEMAQAVARRLAQLFLEENVESRTETVTQASSFLAEQAAELKEELTRTELALADFKQRHAGSLPDDANLNTQRLDRAQRDLDSVEREIRTLQERKNMLMTELAQTSASATLYTEDGDPILGAEERLEMLRREYVSLAARYSSEHPDVVRLRREIALLSDDPGAMTDMPSVQAELDAKRAELAQLRERYADDHPDVRRLERTIDGLLEQLESAPASSPAPRREASNPEYLQLQVQLDGVDTELAALREDRQMLRDRVDEYEASIENSPQIESELLALTRDYELARRDYNDIREKQAEAERAITIERQQRAERYVLQRGAGLPESPAQPTHSTIVVVGLFLGFTAALGAGLLTEALDPSVRGARDLRAILETGPIAMVPSIDNGQDVWRRATRRGALAVSAAAVAILSFSAAA